MTDDMGLAARLLALIDWLKRRRNNSDEGTIGYTSYDEYMKTVEDAAAALTRPPPEAGFELALNVRHPKCHESADAFWNYWRENGETHKHGYYESTWGAINRAIRLVGVVPHDYGRQNSNPTADAVERGPYIPLTREEPMHSAAHQKQTEGETPRYVGGFCQDRDKCVARNAELAALKHDIARAVQANTELLADAERYRAMRNGETDPDMEQPYCTVHKTNSWGKLFNTYETGDELDAAIDAARKGASENG